MPRAPRTTNRMGTGGCRPKGDALKPRVHLEPLDDPEPQGNLETLDDSLTQDSQDSLEPLDDPKSQDDPKPQDDSKPQGDQDLGLPREASGGPQINHNQASIVS